MRALTALVLVVAGVLFHAASWQRWAGHCPWGSQQETAACNKRMDHLYDFLFVGDPWEPIGSASELAGVSLLLVALAFLALSMGPPRTTGSARHRRWWEAYAGDLTALGGLCLLVAAVRPPRDRVPLTPSTETWPRALVTPAPFRSAQAASRQA